MELEPNELLRTQAVELATPDLIRMFKELPETFLEYFLGPQMKYDAHVRDFHLAIFLRMIDMSEPRDVIAIPRDHAKTTILRLAIVWLILFKPIQFFIYMSTSNGAAAASLQVVWQTLNSDEFTAIFPEVYSHKPYKLALSDGHIECFCPCYDNEALEPRTKFIILKAQGAESVVRGMNLYGLRPQYVACDDIEGESATKSEEGYNKFKFWFDNTFMRAVSDDEGMNKVCQIGNLIAARSLLGDNMKDPDWRSMRLGIIMMNGEPLWPTRFPLAKIRRDFLYAKRRKQLAGWFAELMNLPVNTETSLINVDEITWSAPRASADGNEYRSYVTVDPAISQKDSADACAIVLHTIDDYGVPQVTEYVHGRGMTTDEMAEIILDMCSRWGTRVVGVEAVQLQEILLDFFKLRFATSGMTGFSFVPIRVGRASKTAKLSVFAGALRVGDYTLSEDDIDMAAQLSQYDITSKNNDDDLADAGSMGLYMLKYHMTDINNTHLTGKAASASAGQLHAPRSY